MNSRGNTVTQWAGVPTPLVALLCVLVFATDVVTPPGLVHGIWYVPCILLAATRRKPRSVVLVTALCAVLLIANPLLFPASSASAPWEIAVANRALTLALLVATALSCLYFLRLLAGRDDALETARRTRLALEDEQRLRGIACELGAMGGWVVDLADMRLQLSEETAAIHGVDPGRRPAVEHAVQMYAPEYRARIRALFDACAGDGTPFDDELEILDTHGRRVWVRVIGRAILGADGRVERVHGGLQDISRRKQDEQQVEQLANRLTTTLQSITEGFFLVDREWRFSFVNDRAEHLLGRRRDELLGKVLWDAYAPALGTVFETEYRRAMASGEAANFVSHYPPLGMWFEVHAFPSAEGLAVYFQDITARRKADAHLRLLEAAIGRINDIVLITEAAPLDEPGPRIVFANHAFERRLGYPQDEVIGQTTRMLHGPATSRAELDRIHQALLRGEPVRAQVDNITRTGEPVVLELDIVPLHDEAGTLTHFVSVERDVTERVELHERMQQAQRMESIGQLTGGLAHDFNNLLTVILGNAEILVESLPATHRAHELAQLISGASERAATLVQRLLSFARQQSLEPEAVDLAALVADIANLLRRSLGEQVTLEVDAAVGLPPALVDPAQLEHALVNLCLNARDAMSTGGRLGIRVSAVSIDADRTIDLAPGHYLQLDVSDTGCGIAPEHLARVFEPFFTTKDRTRGTGLGLSMVYGFAKQSHGHVEIESTPGRGTRITLYLPAAAGPARSRPPATMAGPAVPAERPARILVVEDHELVREFACTQLRGLGYEVLAAENGPAALAIVEGGAALDLMFTDIVMPGGLSGLELADRVRAIRPSLPILLTSGFADGDQAAIAEGRYPTVGKPYRPHDLSEHVRKALSFAAAAPVPGSG